jgi:hypothetical protein
MDKRQRYTDKAMNAFKKTNLFYANGPFLGIQDPTVFGFKLFFHFDNIDSPLLYGANSDIQSAPTNTAAGYLKSIGDTQRLYYLEKFIYLLSGVNSQTPWYFQTLAGLKDAWVHDFTKPYIGEDKKITIECIESIDLRVTALLDLYRKACYDWKYRREVVPKNLRQFKLSVYVYETRVIQNPNSIATTGDESPPSEYGFGGNIQGEAAKKNAELVNRLTGRDETRNDPDAPNVNTVEGVKMSTTRNLFHFDFCEFNTSEPGHLETINNTEPAEVKQKIDIMYQDVDEENMYNFWTSKDPITDSYVASLDKLALDDPQFQEPGVPLETNQIPSVEPAPPAQPGGDAADVEEEGKLLKENLIGSRIRDRVGEAFESVSANLGDKEGRIRENTFIDDLGQSLANQAIGNAQNAANAFVSGLFLGNVYGFSPGTLIGAAGAQQTAASILDAGPSIANNQSTSQVGNKIYDPGDTNATNSTSSGWPGERDTDAF